VRTKEIIFTHCYHLKAHTVRHLSIINTLITDCHYRKGLTVWTQMTSVLDQQVSGQAFAMGSKGDGGGDPPEIKPSDVGREHQEEASEDCKSSIERRNDADTSPMLTIVRYPAGISRRRG